MRQVTLPRVGRLARPSTTNYTRYHIATAEAPDVAPWPSRFKVHVSKIGLAKYLIKEIVAYKGDKEVILNRPCMYGVFSGPVGGFAPREQLCVGCLRCTTQHPDFVRISHNPERRRLGDAYFHFEHVNTIAYEAATGRVPVKGAGYRGQFGGDGWDGMWTDMSEIVRPTRDGIHGREFISTAVDIGAKPSFLRFGPDGALAGPAPRTFSLPLPFLFDAPATAVASPKLHAILARTAAAVDSLAMLPITAVLEQNGGDYLVPLVRPDESVLLDKLAFAPRMVAMDGWDPALFATIGAQLPDALVCLRLPFGAAAEGGANAGEDLLRLAELGVSVFHLTADYHGRGADGRFVFDLIRDAHQTFVDAGLRDTVTLLGSGGIIAAEHAPKAIIAGLDAVVLDTPLLVALQARFAGDFVNRHSRNCALPDAVTVAWGAQRLQNLMAAWRDQLLEILGAMGIREVRRLRGEMGRAMFQEELERAAFAGIAGYPG